MKIDTMFRHAREAFKSLRRNTWMTFAAVSAVAVTLLIFGFFLVFAFNINYLAKELDQQVAIRASIVPPGLPPTTSSSCKSRSNRTRR